MAADDSGRGGRFAYEGLDRLMHEKARLAVLTSLLAHPEGVLFGDLRRDCALTDGNLSRHLQTLKEAGLIELWKGYAGRRPQTLCRLSHDGRERFLAYLDELRRVVADAAAAEHGSSRRRRRHGRPAGDWVPV